MIPLGCVLCNETFPNGSKLVFFMQKDIYTGADITIYCILMDDTYDSLPSGAFHIEVVGDKLLFYLKISNGVFY